MSFIRGSTICISGKLGISCMNGLSYKGRKERKIRNLAILCGNHIQDKEFMGWFCLQESLHLLVYMVKGFIKLRNTLYSLPSVIPQPCYKLVRKVILEL